MQNYRRAEGKERQRTAFILLVSAGWENSSLDMCVSGDAVRSPGETDEGSLGSISRRVSALNICPYVDVLVTLILSLLRLFWVSP